MDFSEDIPVEVFKLELGMALEERSRDNKHLKRPWLGKERSFNT